MHDKDFIPFSITSPKKPILNTSERFNEVYQELENKSGVDYWTPYSQLITESMETRQKVKITQKQLAELMDTKQSVISRFENMGRLPSYDFIARLAIALNHSPGMTLYGEFMAVVPCSMQEEIRVKANEANVPTREFVQKVLEHALKPCNWNELINSQQREANDSFFNLNIEPTKYYHNKHDEFLSLSTKEHNLTEFVNSESHNNVPPTNIANFPMQSQVVDDYGQQKCCNA
ncbi:MAG: helix-turn-helix transcriptional regulator [bacterium]